MEKILIETKDNKLFDIENKIVEIVSAMINNRDLIIDLNFEGPCCRTIGLYSILDTLTSTLNYPKNKITIVTANDLEHHSDYKIAHSRINGFLKQVKFTIKNQHTVENKNFNDDMKHFGIFISRANWQRLWLTSKLFTEYKDQTILTFHYDKLSDYHKDNLEFDLLLNLVNDEQSLLKNIFNLLENSPITLDKHKTYPILVPQNLKLDKYYKNFFVEIVCETYFSGNTFFPTEKTFRPILMKTPFIIQGPKDYLNNLKKIGFKTFDRWWSELYQDFNKLPIDSEIVWSTKEIFKVVEQISKMKIIEIKSMYNDMLPTIEHNYELLVNG